MEEIKKRKRGRPKKIKLPDEVQSIIDATKQAKAKEEKEFIQDIEKDIVRTNFEWDYPISQTISYYKLVKLIVRPLQESALSRLPTLLTSTC